MGCRWAVRPVRLDQGRRSKQSELAHMDDAAHPQIWRAWFMALCALSVLLLVVGQVLILTVEGDSNVHTVATGVPFVERVTAAPLGSAVHAGDIIDVRSLRASVRWSWTTADFFEANTTR